MSIMGTTVAAGVAQTGLQAQQLARRRDQRANRPGEESRRLRETFESHLLAIEEGEQPSDPLQLHIHTQMHDQPSAERDQTIPTYSLPDPSAGHDLLADLAPPRITDHAQLTHEDTVQTQNDQADAAEGDPPSNAGGQDNQLYQHLDVTG